MAVSTRCAAMLVGAARPDDDALDADDIWPPLANGK
jgi:hypothetical protein